MSDGKWDEKIALLDNLSRKGNTFKFQDAAEVSLLDRGSLKVLLLHMENEGLIEHIEKGKYLLSNRCEPHLPAAKQ